MFNALLIGVSGFFKKSRAGLTVTEVELLNPYNPRDFLEDKLTEVDVKARDKEGRVYQIEVQLVLGPHMTRRVVYTWGSVMAKQIKKGAPFSEVRPVISIWLLKKDLFSGGGRNSGWKGCR